MPLSALLRCRDLQETRDWYEAIGFNVSDSAQGTLTVTLQGCRLVFTEGDLWNSEPGCSGTFYLSITDLEHYHEQVKERVILAWPLQDMPYGSREFGVRDCNGYYLAFSRQP
ncbi:MULTISPECIES: bleomycin resistance family protein [unclassified Pseudomonas]|uniref:bleomycin resistance family protein n=1 Tax=unclassified Pseudomonas TaxID=196821 RepID=UPI0035BEFD51